MKAGLMRYVPRTRRAKWSCAGCGVAIAIIFAAMLVPAILGSIVRSRLQALVSDQLNAELKIGRFAYHAPYGVTVYDAQLVAKGPDGQPVDLLDFRQLDLTLARSPLRSGPLVIQELLIRDPSLHLIHTADGLVGERSLIKTPGGPQPPQRKLSEIFELRRISIERGQVVYEDRTRPGAVPLAWRGLQLDLHTQPSAPAVYGFQLKAGAPPLATIEAAGDMNIDDLVLRIASSMIDASIRPDAPESTLPADLQERLRAYAIDGRLPFAAAGTMPLRDIEHSTFDGMFALTDARGKVPQQHVDLSHLAVAAAFKSVLHRGELPSVELSLKEFDARTADASVHVQKGRMLLRHDGGCAAEGIAGAITFAAGSNFPLHPQGVIEFAVDGDIGANLRSEYRLRNVALTVPTCPQRFEQLNGVVRVAQTVAHVENLTVMHGEDAIEILGATVPLSDLARLVQIHDIDAVVNFGSPAPKYPDAVAGILATIGPIGKFALKGDVDVDTSKPEPKSTYKLIVSTEIGAVKFADVKAPVIFPRGVAVITPDAVDVTGLDLPVFGGSVAGDVHVRLNGRTTYEGSYAIKNIELEKAKVLWEKPDEKPQDLRGGVSGSGRFWGVIPEGKGSALDVLRVDGMLQVANGYLYDAPVLQEIADWLKIDGGSVIGDAAATFAIQDRVVNLKRGVVSSPVLAAQGKGDIGFDGKLQLVVTAAYPQNRGRPAEGGNDFVRGLLGAVNQGLAAAGQWGLYEFHVTGDTTTPRLRVETPAINQSIDSLVGGIKKFARDAGRRQ